MMRGVRRYFVWAVVVALYVYGVSMSAPNPQSGAIVFVLSLWPILVAELSRSDDSLTVFASMALPVWFLGGLFLFQGALSDSGGFALPEDVVGPDITFRCSTAFLPGGLLAGFALKRMNCVDEQRDYVFEIVSLAPWIVLYIGIVIGLFL
ncbi:MAG: hypothetical protein ABIV13_00265 [Fimbriimonadales bacterium]